MLDSDLMTRIKTGISSSATDYYLIGGAILLVLVSIWAFRMIRNLMDDDRCSYPSDPSYQKGSPEYYAKRHAYRSGVKDQSTRWARYNNEY